MSSFPGRQDRPNGPRGTCFAGSLPLAVSGCFHREHSGFPRVGVCSDTICAEVTPAPEFIDPHPRPDRLEEMRSEPGRRPERRRRVFRRAEGRAAAGRAAGAHHRLGHSLRNAAGRAVRPRRRRIAGRARSVSDGVARGQAGPADQHPDLGFRGAVCGRARMEFRRQVHGGRQRADPVLPGLQPSAGIVPASENRRDRQRDRLLRRARPHDPALGHQRASRRASAAPRSRRQALPAIPRCPVHGRGRGRGRARRDRGGAVGRRRLHGGRLRNRRGRSLARLGAGGGDGRSRPASRGPN